MEIGFRGWEVRDWEEVDEREEAKDRLQFGQLPPGLTYAPPLEFERTG